MEGCKTDTENYIEEEERGGEWEDIHIEMGISGYILHACYTCNDCQQQTKKYLRSTSTIEHSTTTPRVILLFF